MINIDNEEYCFITVGGVFIDECEPLVINGKNMGIIDIEEKTPLIALMVETEPAILMNGENLSPQERDKKRGDLLRENV